jgi:hypothetical protein
LVKEKGRKLFVKLIKEFYFFKRAKGNVKLLRALDATSLKLIPFQKYRKKKKKTLKKPLETNFFIYCSRN